MWRITCALVVAATLVEVAPAHAAPAEDLTIKAAAPDGLSEKALGRPYSTAFQPLVGKEGKSVFPEAKVPIKSEASSFTLEFREIRNSHELAANASGWGVEASGSASSSKRHLYYRAVQITSAVEIDDTTEPRSVSATGAYYLRKIYYGRTYEVLISADASVLSGEVKAKILSFGGEVSAMKSKFNVTTQIFSRGLKPKASAIFATTDEEVRKAYTEDKEYNYGNPVPILVEYRRVPGAAFDDFEEVIWQEVSSDAQLVRAALQVDSKDSDWQSCGITLGENDWLVGTATGKVSIGKWSDDGVPGTRTNGGLEIKIGAKTFQGGGAFVVKGTEAQGEVKFRVRDDKYTDNKGSFEVVTMLLPSAALAAAADVGSKGQ